MEKYLDKFILVKHLIYIIQEYCREKYSFLHELKNNTYTLYYDFNTILYYEHYTINFRKIIPKTYETPSICRLKSNDWCIVLSKPTQQKMTGRKRKKNKKTLISIDIYTYLFINIYLLSSAEDQKMLVSNYQMMILIQNMPMHHSPSLEATNHHFHLHNFEDHDGQLIHLIVQCRRFDLE